MCRRVAALFVVAPLFSPTLPSFYDDPYIFKVLFHSMSEACFGFLCAAVLLLFLRYLPFFPITHSSLYDDPFVFFGLLFFGQACFRFLCAAVLLLFLWQLPCPPSNPPLLFLNFFVSCVSYVCFVSSSSL